jgi:hypothetical protein
MYTVKHSKTPETDDALDAAVAVGAVLIAAAVAVAVAAAATRLALPP